MVAVVLGLAAGCCFGWADFLGGLASRRIGARTVVLGGRALSLALLAVPLALIGDSIHGGSVVFGGLAGVAGTVGLLALFRAMELGDIGTASPIAALGAGVPVVAGLLAGERPTVAALIGIPLALAGGAPLLHLSSPPAKASATPSSRPPASVGSSGSWATQPRTAWGGPSSLRPRRHPRSRQRRGGARQPLPGDDRGVGLGDHPRTRDPLPGCRDRRRTHRRRLLDRRRVIRQERSRPSRTAHAATSVREDMPNLARMFDTWPHAARGGGGRPGPPGRGPKAQAALDGPQLVHPPAPPPRQERGRRLRLGPGLVQSTLGHQGAGGADVCGPDVGGQDLGGR